MNLYQCIAPDVKLGDNVTVSKFVNLYGCEIGDESKIGAFVEIQKNAKIGKRCKISSHSFICEGVTIEDEVFIGHGVTFINDTYPRATAGGRLQMRFQLLDGGRDLFRRDLLSVRHGGTALRIAAWQSQRAGMDRHHASEEYPRRVQ